MDACRQYHFACQKQIARILIHLFERLITPKLSFLFFLLETHELDVLPQGHDNLRTRGYCHVHHICELRTELEALGVLVSVEIDGNVHVLVPVALEDQLVEVSGGRRVRRVGHAIWFFPFYSLLGAVANLAAVEVDGHSFEEVRETRLWHFFGGHLWLFFSRRICIHLVCVVAPLGAIIFLIFLIDVVVVF